MVTHIFLAMVVSKNSKSFRFRRHILLMLLKWRAWQLSGFAVASFVAAIFFPFPGGEIKQAWFSRTVKSVHCFLSQYHGYHIFVQFLLRVCRRFPSRKLCIYTETSISCINLIKLAYLHFPNFVFFFFNSMTDAYLRALFAFSGLYQAHDGHLSKMIYRKLMIIGSHVTVGAPSGCGMFGGVW